MKKFLYLILTLFIVSTSVWALDVVYPTNEYSKINSPSSFFVGAVNKGEKLFLNDEEINVHRTGAFAQPIKLNIGKNEFKLKSGKKEKIYIIERPNNSFSYAPPKLKEFSEYKTVEISRNGAPIRTTSVQSGINRISHFKKGIKLKATAELGDMYRVKLSPIETAWVAKSDVKVKTEYIEKTFLYDYRKKETPNEYIYEFALSKKTPYSVTEGNELVLKIYNVGANDNDTAIFKFTLNQRLMGYDVKFKGDTLILSIKKEPKLNKKLPLKDVKIVVDAGHGGRELGAVGCCRNYEKDFNLSIAKYLEQELKAMGANVYMTRNFDRYVSLNDRVKYTNDKNAQIFISIHANSLPDALNPQKHRGASVYYYYEEAKPLSQALINSISKHMPVNIEGVKQASFAVVRNTSAVSVLVETAYVINPDDNELLMTDNFRRNYAKSLADGIKDYVWQVKPTKLSWFNRKKIKIEHLS